MARASIIQMEGLYMLATQLLSLGLIAVDLKVTYLTRELRFHFQVSNIARTKADLVSASPYFILHNISRPFQRSQSLSHSP